MVLGLLLGALGGYIQGKGERAQYNQQLADKQQQAQAKNQQEIDNAANPEHPSYWDMQLKQEKVWTARQERLLGGGGDLRHTMGIESQLDDYVRGNGGLLPELGSDSERAAMELLASGLSTEEANKLDSEWSNKRMRVGRAVVSAVEQDGLDLGNNIGGQPISLKRDRYGKGYSQVDFLSEAIDEFAAFVPVILSDDPSTEFRLMLDAEGIDRETPEYDAAMKKFSQARAFWGSGFGATFLQSSGKGAPQAAQQALDRISRGRGYWNGQRIAAYDSSAEGVVEKATGKARGNTKSSGDAIKAAPPGAPRSSAPPATRGAGKMRLTRIATDHPENPPAAKELASARDAVIFPDEPPPEPGQRGFTPGRGYDAQKMDSRGGVKTQAIPDLMNPPESPYQSALSQMPEEMKVAPDFNPQVMELQFTMVSKIIDQMTKNPGETDPDDLEWLELKLEQGWWPHLIAPALKGFKGKIESANEQDGLDKLYRSMKEAQPKTWMLGG